MVEAEKVEGVSVSPANTLPALVPVAAVSPLKSAFVDSVAPDCGVPDTVVHSLGRMSPLSTGFVPNPRTLSW